MPEEHPSDKVSAVAVSAKTQAETCRPARKKSPAVRRSRLLVTAQ